MIIVKTMVLTIHEGEKGKAGMSIDSTLAREFHGFRVWGKFVFRNLELKDTPTKSK